MENYITDDMANVTLSVIEGTVTYESELNDKVIKLTKGDYVKVPADVFHKITTISSTPSCFMYTYLNQTVAKLTDDTVIVDDDDEPGYMYSPFPILENTNERYNNLKQFLINVFNAIASIIYDVPMVRRKKDLK